jgi:membrane associated rhomboid family serine protease
MPLLSITDSPDVSQFSHVDFLHLLFNVSALWSLGAFCTMPSERAHLVPQLVYPGCRCSSAPRAGVLEKSYGSLDYLQMSFHLLVSCGLIVMALYWVAITVFRREHYAKQHAVGYSCVIFALMTIAAVRQPGMRRRGVHPSCHCTWCLS